MKSTRPPSQPITMERTQILELTKRLDAIIRLLALSLPQDMTQQIKIELLSESGFQPKEIAGILGTTPATVSSALVRLKKRAEQASKVTPEQASAPALQGDDTHG